MLDYRLHLQDTIICLVEGRLKRCGEDCHWEHCCHYPCSPLWVWSCPHWYNPMHFSDYPCGLRCPERGGGDVHGHHRGMLVHSVVSSLLVIFCSPLFPVSLIFWVRKSPFYCPQTVGADVLLSHLPRLNVQQAWVPRLTRALQMAWLYLCLVLGEVLVALVPAGDERAGCQMSILRNWILASSSNQVHLPCSSWFSQIPWNGLVQSQP